MTDSGLADARSRGAGDVMVTLSALAAVLFGFGDGLGWPGLFPVLAGLDGSTRPPALEVAGIGVLTAGVALTARLAARRHPGPGGLFGRVWGGVLIAWTTACGLVAVMAAFMAGGYAAGGWPAALATGASAGALRGALLGWAVAAAVVAAHRRQSLLPHGDVVAQPGHHAAVPSDPASRRKWRPGPYLTLTGIICTPFVATALWARLFLSDDREPDCTDWCMSDRDGVYFLLFLAAYFAVPAWVLLMGMLGALRLIPTVRSWPLLGQVAPVLTIGVAIGGSALLMLRGA